MGRPNQAPGFKKLEQKWIKKLAKAGFEDAEDRTLPDPPLKSFHSLRFRPSEISREVYEAKLAYFSQAERLLNTYPFKSNRDRKIWRLHSEGAKTREIAPKVKLGQTRVQQIISEIAKRIKGK